MPEGFVLRFGLGVVLLARLMIVLMVVLLGSGLGEDVGIVVCGDGSAEVVFVGVGGMLGILLLLLRVALSVVALLSMRKTEFVPGALPFQLGMRSRWRHR